MFGIFIKTFFRNVLKNKGFFIVNLLGFTLGLVVSMLIFLYIANELRYDRYHQNSERIYRLCIRASIGDTKFQQAFSSARVLREMRENYPEIEDAVKTLSISDISTRVDDRVYYEDLFVMADSSLFTIFTFPVINGDPVTALVQPNNVALSETTAKKYFGNTDCLGELIEIDVPYIGKAVYTVSCIYRDMPDHSHFHFNLVVSSTSFPDLINNNGWSNNSFITYLLLEEGVSYPDLENKFVKYVYDVFGGEEEYKSREAQGDSWEFFLQPLEKIHLYSDINGEWETNGNIKYIYIFSVVALFVLIIACINFVNLSVAKSTMRSQEVAIRKTLGSSRRYIIFQFMAESLIITFLSLVLSLILVRILLPYYNDWLDRSIGFDVLIRGRNLLGLLLGWLIISVLSGLYPAFFVSSYKPLKVLKFGIASEKRGLGIRNVLVIIQFAASIFLIIGTIVISREMRLLRNDDLGFDKSNILVVQTPPSFSGMQGVVKNEIERFSSVQHVSYSSSLPGRGFNNIGFRAEGVDKSFTLNLFSADPAYDDILKLKMADGRFFSTDRYSDSTAVILNENAVNVIGIESPIGKHINSHSVDDVYKIIGVVNDFHYESKHREMRPMAIFFQGGPRGSTIRYMSVRFNNGSNEEVLKKVNGVWDKHMAGIPFRHFYLAEDYDSLYHNEKQTGDVFTLLSILAILVACMGLFGLSSFIADQRKPEVAIRKVMGASINEIIVLLNRKYLWWLVVAFIIACPVAYYIMLQWLNNFAYKISIGPFVFLLAGLVTLFLALVTVSGITSRTARSNPASVLRNE
ncbi:MAG: FtsX-like permease family protein [Bacteroidales bacterium]|jgi:putative ABC transport system permease protein|nr:FtsX-like permease family protein [Bacteroidales bacterium]